MGTHKLAVSELIFSTISEHRYQKRNNELTVFREFKDSKSLSHSVYKMLCLECYENTQVRKLKIGGGGG